MNTNFLRSTNITHVLNAAEGIKTGCVNTSEVTVKNVDQLKIYLC